MNKFRRLDLELISFILLIVVIGGVTLYVPTKRLTTLWTCLDKGYTSSVWTPKHGGMCSRVDNGNSVLVKVSDLK